jgi:hypothetical protein
MRRKTYAMREKVWLHAGMDGWHFVHVRKKASREIKDVFGRGAGGFGSIPVLATAGKTSWKTSIFPDKASGAYLLPLKAQVRRKEGIAAGAMLSYSIEVVM